MLKKCNFVASRKLFMVMKNKFSKTRSYWSKYWWQALVVATSFSGIVLGVIGFIKLNSNNKYPVFDGMYDTFRMFLLNHQFDENVNILLNISRWLIFITFLLVSFRLFVTIVTPRFFLYKKIHYCYKDHIIVCGLNEISMELINRYYNQQMVIITDENNQYIESLKQRKIKFIIGEPTDSEILNIANINKASCLYAIIDEDKKNVEIAQAAFSFLKENKSKEKKLLKCYTIIKDRGLKDVLGDSALFKYTVKDGEKFFFDGILLNMNEFGIRYSICKNIQQILPNRTQNLDILIVGLSDKSENVIFSLAHCLTMERKNISFTVVEKNKEKIDIFQNKYPFITQFSNFEYLYDIPRQRKFASIFMCVENQLESIKKAVSIRYDIGENSPVIFTFCDNPEDLHEALNKSGKGIVPLIERNIHLINSFEEAFEYVVDLNAKIEEMAEKAHNIWRTSEKDEYKLLSEHFKQSNRNQVLDNYIRAFLLTGKTFNALLTQQISITASEHDKETLAMMEHRRWMIEKLVCGWRYGEKRDDDFKRRPNLKLWEDNLSDENKKKDFKAIELMIKGLNNRQS